MLKVVRIEQHDSLYGSHPFLRSPVTCMRLIARHTEARQDPRLRFWIRLLRDYTWPGGISWVSVFQCDLIDRP